MSVEIKAKKVRRGHSIPGLDNAYVIDVETVGYEDIEILFNDAEGGEGTLRVHRNHPIVVDQGLPVNYTVVPCNSFGYFKYSALVKAQNGEELGNVNADSKWDFNRRLRKIIRDYETQAANMRTYSVDSTGKRVVNDER